MASLSLWSLDSSAATNYVWRDNPSPLAPYTTWATAATSIQDAIDVALDGDTVLVTNGVYDTGGRAVYSNTTNRIAINRPIQVHSANGPAVTAIMGKGPLGDGAIRCAYVGTNAILSGFLLTNGHTTAGSDATRVMRGGGAWCEASGLLTNCAFSGNTAHFNGGGAHGGTLNHCTLKGNFATAGGGAFNATLNHCTLAGNGATIGAGAFNSTLNHCTLTGNRARNGGGAYYGTLNHCTLTGNVASTNGGGAINATLNHCTLTGNTASNSGGGAYGGTLNNCIMYYNTAPTGANQAVCAVAYSCTTPLPPGPGNIANEPHFEDRAAGNLHLLAMSPCIDTGTNLLWSPDAVDLDGNPRVVNWIPDMGAYEYQGVVNPDTDGDGMPNAWEGPRGLDPAVSNAPDANEDGDPAPDWEEYVADTSPTNASEFLRLVAMALDEPPLAAFRFVSSTNRLYSLLLSTDLVSAAWELVPGEGPRPGIGGLDTMADTNDTTAFRSRTYRVEAQLP